MTGAVLRERREHEAFFPAQACGEHSAHDASAAARSEAALTDEKTHFRAPARESRALPDRAADAVTVVTVVTLKCGGPVCGRAEGRAFFLAAHTAESAPAFTYNRSARGMFSPFGVP